MFKKAILKNVILFLILYAAFRLMAMDSDKNTVAYWKFNTLDEKTLELRDETGRHTGVLIGADVGQKENFLKSGLFGSAGLFDKGKWHVSIPHNRELDFTDNLLIECIIKPFDCSSFRTIIWKGSRQVNPEEINYFLNIRDGKIEFKMKTADGQWVVYLAKNIPIEVNNWYHVAALFTAGKAKIFINGEESALSAPSDVQSSISALVPNDHRIMIGDGQMTSGGSAYSFIGLIDEIKISSAADYIMSDSDKTDLILKSLADKYNSLESINQKQYRVLGKYMPGTTDFGANYKELGIETENLDKNLNSVLNMLIVNTTGLLDALDIITKSGRAGQFRHTINNFPPDENTNTFKRAAHDIQAKLRPVLAGCRNMAFLSREASRVLGTLPKVAEEILKDRNKEFPDFYTKLRNHLKYLNNIELNQTENFSLINKLLEHTSGTARYHNLFSSNQPFLCSVFPSYQNLYKKPMFINDLTELKTKFSMAMAKNEREGFQIIVIGNPSADMPAVTIEIDSLKHTDGISAISMEWGIIESVKTEQPDIDVDFIGEIPDPIIDGRQTIDVKKNDFTPVYIRLFADTNIKAGNYTGKIKLKKNNYSTDISINVEVFDFTLPQNNSLIVGFNFSELDAYKKWYGYSEIPSEKSMYIYDFLFKYRIPPTDKYSGLEIYPKIEHLKQLVEKGRIPDFISLKYFNEKKRLSAEEMKQITDFYKKSISQLKDMGLEKSIYFHSYDEIASHIYQYDFEAVKANLRALQKEFPDIKFIQSSFPAKQLAETGLWNTWMILFNFFSTDKKQIDEVKKMPGMEIWMYNANEPSHPYPNYFIDYPLLDCRIVMTMCYKYGVKGINYWRINREWHVNMKENPRWPASPWKPYYLGINDHKRSMKNGAGNFVYPGPDGKLYPSLRLENFRDGIEDYEYLKLLENNLSIYRKKNPKDEKTIMEAALLLQIPDTVAAAINDYSRDAEDLARFRYRVAKYIEKLGK